jgi:hypothetical protein
MTALGAILYFGFFASAALWLFVTGRDERHPDHDQRPERSNSVSVSAASAGFRSWCASHSSQK